ncbi:hypothetical protein KFU94_56710 [Chloroflexi bacterium TSY]|nr:hypothetical protein [Chloroflexi bacterium TSY]
MGLDQMRSLAEGLRDRHDVLRARSDLLSHLARWIGWEPDLTQEEIAQRNDILFAPELYRTVGTIPNTQALVNRRTGWPCRVKEFVHNVFLTNAPETIRLCELWTQSTTDGETWTQPQPVTQLEEGHDGRPTSVALENVVWLFWHSDRSGRREIWLQRLDGVDPAPRRAVLDAPDDLPDMSYSDEYPAAVVAGEHVRLFWSSNRNGQWDIWTRTYDGLPGGVAENLTHHQGEDRHPVAVHDAMGRLWLFWQSNRRGPTDIWAMVHDGEVWQLPMRLTTADFRHEMPAVVQSGDGRIWLFYVNDLGSCRHLYYQTTDDGEVWTRSRPVISSSTSDSGDPDCLYRDEAPTAIFWRGRIWLFWHANRDGHWQILARTCDTVASDFWSEPFPVTSATTPDKDPAVAIVDQGGTEQLRIFWRSQRRAVWYRSRTLDTTDEKMLGRLGTYEDRAHYTYDTGQGNDDWYARNTVGLYLTPDTADPVKIEQQVTRTRHFVEPFQPLPVRLVWVPEVEVYEEVIDTDRLIDETEAIDEPSG